MTLAGLLELQVIQDHVYLLGTQGSPIEEERLSLALIPSRAFTTTPFNMETSSIYHCTFKTVLIFQNDLIQFNSFLNQYRNYAKKFNMEDPQLQSFIIRYWLRSAISVGVLDAYMET